VATSCADDENDVVWNVTRLGVVVAVAVLTACADDRLQDTATQPSTSSAVQAATTTTTEAQQSRSALQGIGQPFTLGDARLTVLSVQDPFPSTTAVQPAPGNRLVSIRYEVVSQSPVTQNLSDMPAVELHDSTGAEYRSEHGRLSVVGGSRAPGELPAGKRMETSAVFEVPGPATGLRAAFRTPGRAGEQGVMVALD